MPRAPIVTDLLLSPQRLVIGHNVPKDCGAAIEKMAMSQNNNIQAKKKQVGMKMHADTGSQKQTMRWGEEMSKSVQDGLRQLGKGCARAMHVTNAPSD